MTKKNQMNHFQATAVDFPAVFFDALKKVKKKEPTKGAYLLLLLDDQELCLRFYSFESDKLGDDREGLPPHPGIDRSYPHPLAQDFPHLLDRVEAFKADEKLYRQCLEKMKGFLQESVASLREDLADGDFGEASLPLLMLTTAPQAQLLLGKNLDHLGQSPRKFQSFSGGHLDLVIHQQLVCLNILPQPSTFLAAWQVCPLALSDKDKVQAQIFLGSSIEIYLIKKGIIYSTSSLWTPLEESQHSQQSFLDDLAEIEGKAKLRPNESWTDRNLRPEEWARFLEPADFLNFRQAQAALKVAWDYVLTESQTEAKELQAVAVHLPLNQDIHPSAWLALDLFEGIQPDQLKLIGAEKEVDLSAGFSQLNEINSWPEFYYLELSQQANYYRALARAMTYRKARHW